MATRWPTLLENGKPIWRRHDRMAGVKEIIAIHAREFYITNINF